MIDVPLNHKKDDMLYPHAATYAKNIYLKMTGSTYIPTFGSFSDRVYVE